jgi:hypothetical protein
MRITLAMLCVLAASLAGFSQEKSFDLNKYKFPDYKRHELELNFRSNGSNRQETYQNYLSSGEIEKSNNSRTSNSSEITLGYHYDYLTLKRIDYLYSTFTGDYYYSKENTYNQKIVDSNPSMNASLDGSSKYYLIEDKLFLEGFTNLYYSRNKSRRTVTDQPEALSDQNFLDLSAGLGIGIGRMEKVSDLWQAYYILEKLNKQGAFTRLMTEDDVFEFARLTSQLKNKRFFDARLRKIAELTAMDSLLHQQGMMSNSDISYFTTLNDYWSYGNFYERNSGTELLFQASPNYIRSYYKMKDNKANISYQSSIKLRGSLTNAKQLNLYWQRSMGAGITYESLLDSAGNHLSPFPEDIITTNAYLNYGYFPNSRTYISGGINYQGMNMSILKEQDTREDLWQNSIYFNLSGSYYISPQLQISSNVSYSYFDRFSSNIKDKTDFYYALTLRYAIF